MVLLEVDFQVQPDDVPAFVRMYETVYRPALEKQPGFVSSALLESYSAAESDVIAATRRTANVQLQLTFESEAERATWAASTDHEGPWAAATGLSSSQTWTAYTVVG